MPLFRKSEVDDLTESESVSRAPTPGAQEDDSQFENILQKSPISTRGALNPLAPCNMPLCDDADLDCVTQMVDAIICEAVIIIKSDPRGLFCYRYPRLSEIPENDSDAIEVVVADFPDGEATIATAPVNIYNQPKSNTSASIRHWMKIGDFVYSNVIGEIRDYICKWHLSPDTKCVVLSNMSRHDVDVKGTIYFVDAHFSRPTPRCPNPLAVAKVRFIITVSKVLLKHYPVMITYRFEGFNTLYYAIGERAANSWTFQRFYIDTILHTKLHFYAEICECRHGTVDNPKHNVRPTKTSSRNNLI